MVTYGFGGEFRSPDSKILGFDAIFSDRCSSSPCKTAGVLSN